MAVILASGITDANSSDVTVASGFTATVFLTDAAGPVLPADAQAEIQIKSDGGEYFTVGRLTRDTPALVISGPGTYRVRRMACSSAILVEQT
ncbi:MAG: hypothetical protein LCH79_15250 [Proteobacteria bacterium]|nr:hypothetical protein [Pseudomonadota bacterium]